MTIKREWSTGLEKSKVVMIDGTSRTMNETQKNDLIRLLESQ